MFNVKRKDTGKIHQVLDAYLDDVTGTTFFLIWENDNWRWRPASRFVPPNVNIDKQENL